MAAAAAALNAIRGRSAAAGAGVSQWPAARSVDWRMMQFVIASVPAVAVGLWRLGSGIAQTGSFGTAGEPVAGWRLALVAAVRTEAVDPGWLECFAIGFAFFLPLLGVAAVICLFWEAVFAAVLERPADAGWLMTAWLYAAVLPPSTPLLIAVLGISFGAVFGCHVFGGTGRYLVSPALLGALFVGIAFPSLNAEPAWLALFGEAPTWNRLAAEGAAALTDAGLGWQQALAGLQVAVPGAVSALMCLCGAAYLIVRRAASWRTVAGGLLGVLIGATLSAQFGDADGGVAWHWHLSSGTLAFGLAFLLSDPTTMPLTRSARWAHGILAGLLVVLMRVANPAHPEATLSAILLAGLCVPLLDHIAVAAFVRARARRVRE